MPTKIKKPKKAGPWVYSGDNWFRREIKGGGQAAPRNEVIEDVLENLVDAVAMNCGREKLEQAYGKIIADAVMEAKNVLGAGSHKGKREE